MPTEEEEEDEDEANLSLAAMEAELRPQVMETLDRLPADTYKSCASCRISRRVVWLLAWANCRRARNVATRNCS